MSIPCHTVRLLSIAGLLLAAVSGCTVHTARIKSVGPPGAGYPGGGPAGPFGSACIADSSCAGYQGTTWTELGPVCEHDPYPVENLDGAADGASDGRSGRDDATDDPSPTPPGIFPGPEPPGPLNDLPPIPPSNRTSPTPRVQPDPNPFPEQSQPSADPGKSPELFPPSLQPTPGEKPGSKPGTASPNDPFPKPKDDRPPRPGDSDLDKLFPNQGDSAPKPPPAAGKKPTGLDNLFPPSPVKPSPKSESDPAPAPPAIEEAPLPKSGINSPTSAPKTKLEKPPASAPPSNTLDKLFPDQGGAAFVPEVNSVRFGRMLFVKRTRTPANQPAKRPHAASRIETAATGEVEQASSVKTTLRILPVNATGTEAPR